MSEGVRGTVVGTRCAEDGHLVTTLNVAALAYKKGAEVTIYPGDGLARYTYQEWRFRTPTAQKGVIGQAQDALAELRHEKNAGRLPDFRVVGALEKLIEEVDVAPGAAKQRPQPEVIELVRESIEEVYKALDADRKALAGLRLATQAHITCVRDLLAAVEAAPEPQERLVAVYSRDLIGEIAFLERYRDTLKDMPDAVISSLDAAEQIDAVIRRIRKAADNAPHADARTPLPPEVLTELEEAGQPVDMIGTLACMCDIAAQRRSAINAALRALREHQELMDRARLLKRAGEHCEYLQAVTDILAEGQPSYKIATYNLRTSRRIIEDLCTALREEAD